MGWLEWADLQPCLAFAETVWTVAYRLEDLDSTVLFVIRIALPFPLRWIYFNPIFSRLPPCGVTDPEAFPTTDPALEACGDFC